MWTNIVEPCRPQWTVWHMCFAWWIPKSANIRSEYVIVMVFHGKNGCKKAPLRYVIYVLPILLQN
jgi:hypothetical protein